MKSYDGQKMARSFIPQAEELGQNPPLRKKLAHAFGMVVGFGLAIAAEASFVWVILTLLVGTTPGFGQVFGACLLFEYVLARLTMKRES